MGRGAADGLRKPLRWGTANPGRRVKIRPVSVTRARPIFRAHELVFGIGCLGAISGACVGVDVAAARHPVVDGLLFVPLALVVSALVLGIPKLRPRRPELDEALPAPAGTRPRTSIGVALTLMVALATVVVGAGWLSKLLLGDDWPGMVGVFGALILMTAVILGDELRWVKRWERAHHRRLLREPNTPGLRRFITAAQDRYLFIEDQQCDQATAASAN